PKLAKVHPVNGFSSDEVLAKAAALEMASEHPLGQAIVNGAKERKLKIETATEFKSVSGKGIEGKVGTARALIGNQRLLEEAGIESNALLDVSHSYQDQGHGVMLMAIDGRAAGILTVQDPIKESTPRALQYF